MYKEFQLCYLSPWNASLWLQEIYRLVVENQASTSMEHTSVSSSTPSLIFLQRSVKEKTKGLSQI